MNFRMRRALTTFGSSKKSASMPFVQHLLFLLKSFRILLPDLKQLRHTIKLSNTDEGDGNCSL